MGEPGPAPKFPLHGWLGLILLLSSWILAWSRIDLPGPAEQHTFFPWELWNAFSSPRWAYAVPYVDRFPLFAMPTVGYTGYLPFGPVCACFWLAWTHLLRRQGSGARVQGSAGSGPSLLNPEP